MFSSHWLAIILGADEVEVGNVDLQRGEVILHGGFLESVEYFSLGPAAFVTFAVSRQGIFPELLPTVVLRSNVRIDVGDEAVSTADGEVHAHTGDAVVRTDEIADG